MNAKVTAIVSITVIAALFGLYAIFARTTTTVKKEASEHEVGGVGDNILSTICKTLGIKC